MSFSARFLQLRKQNSLTQPQMADRVGIHLTQVRRYESGEAQPSLDILKRIAVTFNVSADWLIFEEEEREPQDELKLKFEAVKQMDEEEQRSVTAVLDALILKYQAKRLIG
ncbi:helix-turn-helix transcriptional regulator [Xenorhabdus griffiniae]|uniref:Helix-turn-helix transcriptional regulator n=1 Tax=Xenorhabdus griffiniae TaxID=351672 RepID=A0ABY9XNV4_9GAMM|nr:helix-turn-helix transcriptional regulator [Xenorhabdus griffiniae]WMV74564.1 helix-turn-helix transcriptional regulator [Xenorhabdus griffiniae]WMV74566.1 helix-turn-helix transcriptional regulator [Xenorhabdus griffiniae]WNH04243.1 helix-turn-helix transcriptional regulator [Xenorhabdus griffiniae]WNH04245.1 helix-turn-helix transcriptional regulator [Xenorhabdus griffiniae]